MARKTWLYTKQITQDGQTFPFDDLGLADENKTLPKFTNPPIINILSVQGDTVVNLDPNNPPTKDGFTVIIGSVGTVPTSSDPVTFSFEIISQDAEVAAATSKDLILASFVKDRFPEWETYCTRKDGLKSADEMLNLAIEEASCKFIEYQSDLTISNISDELKIHVLRVVKGICFGFRHGDSGYKNKPQIVKDMERTLELLEKGLITAKSVRMDAKEREFEENEWFTDNTNLWYES